MRILNFGSLNIDNVYRVEHFVRPGETISAKGLAQYCGGKGLNQSVALARAGAEVWHAGCIGGDGEMLRELLRENGVNIDFLRQADAASGSTVIQVDDSGQNCIIVFGGTNVMQTPQAVQQAVAAFGPGDWLLLQNEVNCIPEMMRAAAQAGMKIALNPSPVEGSQDYPLELADLFLVNELEAAALSGCTGACGYANTAQALRQKYPRAEIVMTVGSAGAVYCGPEGLLRQECFPVEAVDTTAAGDTFTGYFLSEKLRGKDAAHCLRIASRAASIAVSRMGAAPSIPWMCEVAEAL